MENGNQSIDFYLSVVQVCAVASTDCYLTAICEKKNDKEIY